ncbi:Z-ring formation inhibitor MciZ [Priestia abyssalis]|uniref:Z-ring formation inhibitor MciZ n=1 Tax=Priestia abyssalis TaxID=1221450 RepID=UPI000994E9F1|nr:Z-ring formation inhibitor MciZ [Priestia abyssalis]
MKVYVIDNGIILVGKAWQIRAKLKQYSKKYESVSSWIETQSIQSSPAKKS